MGMSIYTAAVVWCLIGQPQTFMSCEVMNAKQKFATEEQCWAVVNAQIARLYEKTELDTLYEPVKAQCFNWLDAKTGEAL